MPKCPDCRDSELETTDKSSSFGYEDDGGGWQNSIYKCPVCKTEFDPEDVGET